ncbi:hypothetical protein J5N97_026431 [Dioscorea zingiberensis]|uniref:Uncharacterized protein n=1 Tax=Dioscorea zingiberensis TaxID=325984 RepID=A0A9D5C385_9LILI|nr:hypothetical protein J5N97_026431 [Dioscorea zingiberensis]
MAKELELHVEGCTFWWKETKSEMLGMSQIKNDLDAVAMALAMDHSKVINVYVKLTNAEISDVVPISVGGVGEGVEQREGKDQAASGQQDGKSTAAANTNEGGSNDQDPLNTIDPQVLEEHFQEADRMRKDSENEDTIATENISTEVISQVVNTPGEILSNTTTEDASLRMKNMTTTRGKRLGLQKIQARKQFPPKPPVLQHEGLERDVEDRSKLGNPNKKRKAWIPPGTRRSLSCRFPRNPTRSSAFSIEFGRSHLGSIWGFKIAL